MTAATAVEHNLAGASKLPIEIQDFLRSPLPPEAITKNTNKSYLSNVKPAYVIQRMNEAFGIGGYKTINREISHERVERIFKKGEKGEYTKVQYIGTVHSTLEIPKYDIHLENFGGSENDDLGDALKGAATDAFTKMCSYLGVALDVYMGGAKSAQFTPRNQGNNGGKPPQQQPAQRPQNTDRRPAQTSSTSAQQPSSKPTQAAPSTPKKQIIYGLSADISVKGDTLLMKVGDRQCATKDHALLAVLKATEGQNVEVEASEFDTGKAKIWQIHQLIDSKPANYVEKINRRGLRP